MLPDELISEILAPALSISDEDFASTASVSPFSTYSESTSAYLLVCKSWLRVATPLLYNVVVKLRIEGAFYTLPLHTVFKYTPNVAHIYLSLDIYAYDTVVGLCKGLPLIHPTRLIIRDANGRKNKSTNKLWEVLEGCIPNWTKLSILDISSFQYSRKFDAERLFKSLATARKLHTVVVSGPDFVDKVYGALKDCPLTRIRINKAHGVTWRYAASAEITNAAAKSLVEYVQDEPTPPAPVPTVNQIQSVSLSKSPVTPIFPENRHVPDPVFHRILYFAMSVPELENDSAPTKLSPRVPLLLVSKRFLRLGLGHYFSHPVLKTTEHLNSLRNSLSKNNKSRLGSKVRSLTILWKPYCGSHTSKYRTHVSRFWVALSTILEKLPSLIRLSSTLTEMPWTTFVSTVQLASATLREVSVYVEKPNDDADPSIFSELDQCRMLTWISKTKFKETVVVDADALSNLEELHILSSDVSFVDLLTCINLDSLSRVVLKEGGGLGGSFASFFWMHGGKLRELELTMPELVALPKNIFAQCPRLETLCVSWPAAADVRDLALPNGTLRPPQVYPSLVKLRLNPRIGSKVKSVSPWYGFFDDFAQHVSLLLPNLKEIEMAYCVWPINERDIQKSGWVRWAEMLLDEKVQLVDKQGKGWRRRLTL
ncbi:hypothetical protein C8F01DRAFT_1286056 [Mycena amicta]|nr:hypothetical protein C8F01DRAFT_1286056 [Mycena amicta]